MLPVNLFVKIGIAAGTAIACCVVTYCINEAKKEKMWSNVYRLCEKIYREKSSIFTNKICEQDIEKLYNTDNALEVINDMYKLFYENMAKGKEFPKIVNKDKDEFMRYLYAVRNYNFHYENNAHKNVKLNYQKLCRKLSIIDFENNNDDKNKIKNYFLQELGAYLNRVILALKQI